jgi:hypothetical protein
MCKTLFFRFPVYNDKALVLVDGVSAGTDGLSLTRAIAASIPL